MGGKAAAARRLPRHPAPAVPEGPGPGGGGDCTPPLPPPTTRLPFSSPISPSSPLRHTCSSPKGGLAGRDPGWDISPSAADARPAPARLSQLVKAGVKAKAVKRGVKEVVKGVRKGSKGVCIIAGNISPLDVVSHLPVLCEDNDVPYCYVPSKEELGAAGQTKRPTSCMLLLPGPVKGKGEDADGKYKESYDEVRKKVKAIAPTF